MAFGEPVEMMESPQIHCGACQQDMQSVDELSTHLKTCPAAKALLLPATYLALGGRDTSHEIGHLVRASSMYASYIREYAMAIATDMPSLQRSEIHQRLCRKLGLDYAEFRPFESSDIKTIPTTEEAIRIIMEAIYGKMQELMSKNV